MTILALVTSLVVLIAHGPTVNASPHYAIAPSLEATVVIDGVKVVIKSPMLPASQFSAPLPDQASQSAIMTSITPYRELSILAVPFGTKAAQEDLDVAHESGVGDYRTALRKFRLSEGAKSLNTPVVSIFGKHVSGDAYELALPLHGTSYEPAVLVEWVSEAGQRVWITRVVVERSYAAVQPGGLRGFVNSLSSIIIDSPNVHAASTLIKAQQYRSGTINATSPSSAKTQNTTANTLSFPSWWNGNCDANAHGSPTSYLLGDSYQGVPTCGPRPGPDQYGNPYDPCAPYCDYPEHFYSGAWPELEWECVELVMRYMYLGYSVAPYSANGNQVVAKYTGSALTQVTNGSGQAPMPGDVISFNTSATAGHTALVASSNVQNGSGTIYILQQNFGGNGYGNSNDLVPMTVSGNTLQDAFGMHATGWLHTAVGQGNPTYKGFEVYTVGSNGHLYHYLNTTGNPASGWLAAPQDDLSALVGVTATLQGTPSSYYFSGIHFVYAIDTAGHLHEFYYTTGWHHQDLSTVVGKTFQGSPSAYGFADPSINNGAHHSVNVIGTDGKLYDVYYTPSVWRVTGAIGSQIQAGSATGYAMVSGTSFTELVYTVDTSGVLREYVDYSGTWQATPLNSWSTLATGVTATGTPNAYAFQDSNGHQDHSVYVSGSNGHLYNLQYRYNGSGFSWGTPAPMSTSVVVSGTPNGHISYQSPEFHFVFVPTNTAGLEEFWQSDGATSWNMQSLVTSGVNGSAAGLSYFPNGTSTLTHITFFPETDGHMHEVYYQYPSWVQVDLGPLSSSVTVNSGASSYGF